MTQALYVTLMASDIKSFFIRLLQDEKEMKKAQPAWKLLIETPFFLPCTHFD